MIQIQKLVGKGEEMLAKEMVDEAKVYLTKAKEINIELGDKMAEALILESFGHCYQHEGDYEKALKMTSDAIAIFKQQSGTTGQAGNANGLGHLGTIYSKLGRYKEAIACQKKAIEILLILGDDPNALGTTYGNMGVTHNRIKEPRKAIELSQEAYRISQKTGNKVEEARSLHNIGDAYNQLGQPRKSISYCKKSARIWTEIGNKRNASVSYGVLATSYHKLGKMETSERYSKMCIDTNLHMKQFHDLAIAYGNRGLMYYDVALEKFLSSGDAKESFESSIENFKLAIESTDTILASLSVDKNKTAFADKFYRWHNSLTAPFNLLGRSTAALLFLDLGRAKILRQLAYNEVENQVEDKGQSSFELTWLAIENEKEKERICVLSKEIQLAESNAAVLFYNFNNAKILTIWVLDANGCVSLKTSDPRGMFTTAQEELEDNVTEVLQKASVGFSRGYSFLKPSPLFDVQNAKKSIPKHALNQEKAEATGHNDKEANDIKSKPECRSPAVRADESRERLAKETRSLLYRALITPVKSLINGKKLIIVPDGCLFFAPFSSFIDENGCLLSEEYQIQTIPSVYVLAMGMQSSSNRRIGNSLFVGNPECVQLPSLPSAAREVEYLASLLDAKPLTGRMATKRKILELMSKASIIHIASHGHEGTGHIFLASESNKPNDGTYSTSSSDLLTQSDVLQCKLSARLVVLSCCHSGMGNLSSEGVLGIARSFLGAGASSILVTLWTIDDEFTKQFMEVFYEKILEEKSVCLALKETMNIFQRSGQYTSFLYWAAFQILGEDVSFTKLEIEEIRGNNKKIMASN
ncbi:tetratricopeptide repeat 28-like [Paramuricea clavata]|uniref:Tetratricopeptide repeat 28-like n=1 Tax=Paramuricea clavata TaxID=317549 RepID=A0A6S7GZP6_PARCT|nr:tetratricopeptide repeat 28-like [Paramuricea clavata]